MLGKKRGIKVSKETVRQWMMRAKLWGEETEGSASAPVPGWAQSVGEVEEMNLSPKLRTVPLRNAGLLAKSREAFTYIAGGCNRRDYCGITGNTIYDGCAFEW